MEEVPLRIGVLGTGNMGSNHVRVLSSERHFFDCAGVFDSDDLRAGMMRERYGVKVFKDADALLDSVEAVVIAVPSSLHLEMGLKAARRKIHTLMEKPLASTSADAEKLTQAFDKDTVLMTGHVERFNPVVIELKKILEGVNIVSMEIHRYSPYTARIMDVSVVEDLMIHDIELACHLMGGSVRKETIHKTRSVVKSDRTDFAVCMMGFSSGASAVISASRVSQEKERRIKIHTEDSYIEADLLNRSLTVTRGTHVTFNDDSDNLYTQDSVTQRIFVPQFEPLREELRSFYRAVRYGAEVAVDGRSATDAIRICEEVLR